MVSAAPLPRPGKGAFRAGWALSGLAIAFFLTDGAMKIANPPIVGETSAQLGWPADYNTILLLAALLLGSTLLYAIPRTAMLGAILLTGYLGGAVATHVRVGSPLFTHVLFGVYLGVIVWGGLWLRDPRLRALLPLRTDFVEDQAA
ncbi:MAG TPA: DoxX family protein [Allosphingosinicella sp.]|nr:DoxX family protein [Allosphingosinicella sp.]